MKCTKCKKDANISEFYSNNSWCRSCMNEYSRNYRKCDKNRRYQREYRIKNIDKSREYQRDWAKKFRESDAGRKKIEEHRKSVKYKDNKKAYSQRMLATNVEVKLRHAIRGRLRMAIKTNQKVGSAVKDLGCSIKELKLYLENKFKDGMSWSNYGEWHIDHIAPLSKFNLSVREEFLIANNFSNLQPLWAIDNLKKSNKIS